MPTNGSPATAVAEATGYNWRPNVHVRFGERLYFYLLRLKSPLRGNEVAERVRKLLDAADISHACEYAVFGHWDILIRVWLSPSWQRQFLARLKEAEETIDHGSFEVSELRYLWTGSDRDLLGSSPEMDARVEENLDDIRACAEDDASADPETRAGLVGAGLLLERPEMDADDPVKFYVALKIHSELRRGEEIARVLAALDEVELSGRASLYSGVGTFADHLIRCVADTYSEVMALSSALSTALVDLEVRPMTLLVANAEARESDNINSLTALTPEDDSVVKLLELNEGSLKLLAGLAPVQREALHKLVKDIYKRSVDDRELREKLRDLVRASLKNERPMVQRELLFLLDFEWFLGRYLKRAWGSVYGPQWIAPLAEEFEGVPENATDASLLNKPEKWSLGDCVKLAIKSAEMNEDVKLQFSKDLGDGWPHQLHTLKRIRNQVAHGKLQETVNFDDFAGEWGELLSEFMTVASLHFRIERLVTSKETSDD